MPRSVASWARVGPSMVRHGFTWPISTSKLCHSQCGGPMSRYRRSYYSHSYSGSWGTYSGSLRPAYDYVVGKFFVLSPAKRDEVLRAWGRRFSTGSAANAGQAFPLWRSGARRMADTTREKIAELVPPHLSAPERLELARLLWRPGNGSRVSHLIVQGSEDLSRVDLEYTNALRERGGSWLGGFPGANSWLSGDLKATVEGASQLEEKRARQAAEPVRQAIAAAAARPGPRQKAEFDLPLQGDARLRVIVTKKAHPFWNKVAPALRATAWVAVLGALAAGVYLWPQPEDPTPARASYATSTPTRAATQPRVSTPTPVRVSTVAAQTVPRTYAVVAGDSWSVIAAKFGVSMQALYAANGLTGPTAALYPGTVLFLPVNATASNLPPGPGPTLNFIPYAGNGGGPTLCRDGSWSHSSGRGTCSHHGGIAR